MSLVLGVGSGGGAPRDAQYVVLVANAALTQERVLTGTANRIVVTDGGAGAAVTLSPGSLIVQTDQANTWTTGQQTINTGAIGTVGLVVKGAAGQTADLVQAQDSTGAAKTTIGLSSIRFQPAADSTTFLQVLDADGGTPILNVDATNERVGIGTNAPSHTLDVVATIGIIRFGDTHENITNKFGRLAIPHYTIAEEPVYIFGATSQSTHNTIAFGGGSALANASTEMGFFTAATTTTLSGTARMWIKSTGYVGIGTYAPQSLLDVAGPVTISNAGTLTVGNRNATTYCTIIAESGVNAENSAVLTTDALKGRTCALFGNGAAYYMGRDVTNDIEFVMGTSNLGVVFVGSMTSHNLHLRTVNTTRIDISTSGNILINGFTAATVGLSVKAAAAQTANLTNWETSAGVALLEVEATGVHDYRWAMGDSTKDPTTDAPADWIEVKIGGAVFYAPVYAA